MNIPGSKHSWRPSFAYYLHLVPRGRGRAAQKPPRARCVGDLLSVGVQQGHLAAQSKQEACSLPSDGDSPPTHLPAPRRQTGTVPPPPPPDAPAAMRWTWLTPAPTKGLHHPRAAHGRSRPASRRVSSGPRKPPGSSRPLTPSGHRRKPPASENSCEK